MQTSTASRHAEFVGHRCADFGVGAFHLVGQRLADVVKQSARLGNLDVDAHFSGQHAGDVAHLHAVLEDVFAVAVAVLQPAQELDQLAVHAAHSGFHGGALALFEDGLFHLFVGAFDHVLYSGRVNAAILHKPANGDPGHFSADRIEA